MEPGVGGLGAHRVALALATLLTVAAPALARAEGLALAAAPSPYVPPGAALAAEPAPPAPERRPITSRWWLWAALGGAVAATVVVVAVASSDGPSPPASTLGNMEAFRRR